MSYTEQEIEILLEEQKRNAQMLIRRDYELQKANEKLLSLDHEKSEFVSIAAHQLRTPLSAIRWTHQILLDKDLGPLTEEQTNILIKGQKTVKRMLDLINDLLDADHLQFDQVSFAYSYIDVQKMLSDIVADLAPGAKEKNISLHFNKIDEQIIIRVDSERIKDVFFNLLDNALKYTPVHGTVTVDVKAVDGECVIAFTDTGIGIPESGRERLFKKFSRFDNAKRIHTDGTGLGLFIVKKIVEAHNGSIKVVSEEGVGSTFIVTLPCKQS